MTDTQLKSCPHESRVKFLEERVVTLNEVVEDLDKDVREIGAKQLVLDGDVKLLMHKVDEASIRSKGWHLETKEMNNELKLGISGIASKMEKHIEESPKNLSRAMETVFTSLATLNSRWWQLVTAGFVVALGIIGYLIDKAGIV
jgi:hypothetical protein